MPTRQEILDAVREFAAAPAAPFVPGETYIPASGKQACPPKPWRRRVGPDEIAAGVDVAAWDLPAVAPILRQGTSVVRPTADR